MQLIVVAVVNVVANAVAAVVANAVANAVVAVVANAVAAAVTRRLINPAVAIPFFCEAKRYSRFNFNSMGHSMRSTDNKLQGGNLRSALSFYGTGFECPIDFTYRDEIDEVLRHVGIVELIPESYFHGRRDDFLKRLGQIGTPVVGHSVDLSMGTAEPFKQKHFERAMRVLDQVNCVVYSDHICMTTAGGIEIGQLTTLPFTQEVVDTLCRKIDQVQRQLKIPFMMENITNRFVVPGAEFPETDFINRITRATGCGLLLDVTNVYINSINHSFDPYDFIDALDAHSIMGIHLAGGVKEDGYMYDTHSRAVHPEVWRMLKHVVDRADPKAVIVEWDQDTPTLTRLLKEVKTAANIVDGKESAPRKRLTHKQKFPAREVAV